jgi:endonuclease YncB( thermonuclease family)
MPLATRWQHRSPRRRFVPCRRALAPLAWALLLLTLALPALAAGRPPAGAVPATLVAVIDGDTLDVLVNDKLERVRYIGIDTPERGQPGYRAATEANRALVTSAPLYLVKDVSERDKTQSARLLRYVYLSDGRLVEGELVAGGWAAPVEYPPDVRFARTYRELAVQAARQRLGFWSPTPPQPDGAMSYALTTGPARVRKGPGTSFAINTNVAKDTPLTVFGRTPAGDWLQVRTPARAGGWISARAAGAPAPARLSLTPAHTRPSQRRRAWRARPGRSRPPAPPARRRKPPRPGPGTRPAPCSP